MNSTIQGNTLLSALILLLSISIQAQNQNLTKWETKLKSNSIVEFFEIDPLRSTPSFVTLNPAKAKKSIITKGELIDEVFNLKKSKQHATYTKSLSPASNLKLEEFQLYYQGVKVDHSKIKMLSKQNEVKILHAELYDLESANISSKPTLTEAQARKKAEHHIGARIYVEEQIEDSFEGPLSKSKVTQKIKLMNEYMPKTELVIVDDFSTDIVDMDLAYKFDVYAMEPLSRDWVYVNAHSGAIMLTNAIIKHGSGDTRYNNAQSFPTSPESGGGFELAGVEPVSGVVITTRSLEGIGGIPFSITAIYDQGVAVTDNDDDWTVAEHRPYSIGTGGLNDCLYMPTTTMTGTECNEANNDDVAIDAQFGAGVVAEYWKTIHNRDSYDGNGAAILSFVHYGDAYDNAFWNGSFMTYGDGSYQQMGSGFAPLTSMDVCAHEIGHAVCTHTSDLVYQRESGAMNEGFSDIWAAAVENYVLQTRSGNFEYDVWGIGEQIDERDGGTPAGQAGSRSLRYMDSPKTATDPDTYGGDHWEEPECGEPTLANDQCGVHSNSGVLNKWFYLLVEGSGKPLSPGLNKPSVDDEINDNGDAYSVSGIGFGKAEQIAFIGETLLNSNSKFADMRVASIAAARTLYGACSNEEIQTTNAWHGVGVGPVFVPCTADLAFNNSFIPNSLLELGNTKDCDSETVIEIALFSTLVSNEVANIAFSGTATEGEDFISSATSLTFNGTEQKSFSLTIVDDAIVEGDEDIIINLTSQNYSISKTITINDDDTVPSPGNMIVSLLAEDFSASTVPTDWTVKLLSPESPGSWRFTGTGTEAGRAYFTDLPSNNTAQYAMGDSHVLLLSPMLNGLGLSNVRVQFDYTVGGEFDGAVFDYGALVISFDGVNFIEIEQYYSANQTGTIETGSVDMILNQLDNTMFQIGFRWFNDALVNGSYSFSVDNVNVKADPISIESDVAHTKENAVPAGTSIFFVSADDTELMAEVNNANQDLSCVAITIDENNTSVDNTTYMSGLRSSKVFDVLPNNILSNYDITLYYTDDEVNDWADASLLGIIAVSGGSSIDDTNGSIDIIDAADVIVDDQRSANGFITYTFTYYGAGKLALSNVACIDVLHKDGRPIISNAYYADIQMNSQGLVQSNSQVSLFGGQEVNLNPQFEVESGALFLADIDDCSSN